MFWAQWLDWERTGGPTGTPPPPSPNPYHRRACTPLSPLSLALMSDYGNEKDHPEDNTSFNPETELNNTDATCAFKCLFERLVVFSRGFSCQKFFFIDRSGHGMKPYGI